MIERDTSRFLLAATLLGLLLICLHQAILRPPLSERFEIGRSIEGRTIACQRFGHGQQGILFISSIHGSEGAGTPLAHALAKQLKASPKLAQEAPVLIVANANPDGLATKGRLNKNGVDLNRNFPADNRRNRKRYGNQALSEPESQALFDLIEQEQPAVIISIHQPVACVDYDGPPITEELATRMAKACRLPVKKLGSRPGSLGAYFGETLGRPIITFELPPLAPHDPIKLWARYGDAMLEAIAFTNENR